MSFEAALLKAVRSGVRRDALRLLVARRLMKVGPPDEARDEKGRWTAGTPPGTLGDKPWDRKAMDRGRGAPGGGSGVEGWDKQHAGPWYAVHDRPGDSKERLTVVAHNYVRPASDDELGPAYKETGGWISDVEIFRGRQDEDGFARSSVLAYHRERIFHTRAEAMADAERHRAELDRRPWDDFWQGGPVNKAGPVDEARDDHGRWTEGGSAAGATDRHGLTDKEKEALRSWGFTSGLNVDTQALRSALDKVPQYKGTVYRGMEFANQAELEEAVPLKPGAVIELPDYTSTTTDPEVVDDFSVGTAPEGGVGVVLVMDTSNGADIHEYVPEEYRDQNEVVLRPGTKYEVQRGIRWFDRERGIRVAHVRLKEVHVAKAGGRVVEVRWPPMRKAGPPDEARDEHGRWTAEGGGWTNARPALASDISRVTPAAPVKTLTVYHVTRVGNVDSILRSGFDLTRIEPRWVNDYAVSLSRGLKGAMAYFSERGKPLDTSRYAVLEVRVRGRFVEAGKGPALPSSPQDFTRRLVGEGYDGQTAGKTLYVNNPRSILSIRRLQPGAKVEKAGPPDEPRDDNGRWTGGGGASTVRVGPDGHGVMERDGREYAGVSDNEWMDWAHYSEDIHEAMHGTLKDVTSQGDPVTPELVTELRGLGQRIQRAAEANAAKGPVKVYRGTRFDTAAAAAVAYPVGTTVKLERLTSTSPDAKVAPLYAQRLIDAAGDGVPVLMTISGKQGLRGVQTAPMGVPSNEFVMPAGMSLRVLRRKEDAAGTIRVWLEADAPPAGLPRVNIGKPVAKSFPDHAGRPGLVGGSMPRGQEGAPAPVAPKPPRRAHLVRPRLKPAGSPFRPRLSASKARAGGGDNAPNRLKAWLKRFEPHLDEAQRNEVVRQAAAGEGPHADRLRQFKEDRKAEARIFNAGEKERLRQLREAPVVGAAVVPGKKPSPYETQLASGELGETKRLGGGVNRTFTATVGGIKAVIKPDPTGGRQPRNGIPPGGDSSREVAAYKVNQMLGGLVDMPTVVQRDLGAMEAPDGEPYGRVAILDWKEGGEVRDAGGFAAGKPDEIKAMGLFDAIIGNLDRHGRNALMQNGHLIAIDHGLSFPVRNVGEWSNNQAVEARDRNLGANELQRLRNFQAQRVAVDQELSRYLPAEPIDAMWQRVDMMVKGGRVYHPGLGRLRGDVGGMARPAQVFPAARRRARGL